jgi:hypothetical protein
MPCPMQRITDVYHRPLSEGHFWTQPMVETHREEARIEQEPRLIWSDVFAREDYVTATMYHQSWLR